MLQKLADKHGVEVVAILHRTSKHGYREAVYFLRRKVNLSLKEVAQLFGFLLQESPTIQKEFEDRAIN